MISECTDCLNCASFAYAYRVFCLHPNLESTEVEKYFPVGEGNAEDCDGFEEGEPEHFTLDEFTQAEEYSIQCYGEVTYEGIREWLEDQFDDVGGDW